MRVLQAKGEMDFPCENSEVAFRFRTFMKKQAFLKGKACFRRVDAHIVPMMFSDPSAASAPGVD